MKQHLVIGASGQVGFHLLQTLGTSGNLVVGTFRKQPLPNLLHLDIRNPEDVDALITLIRPNIVWLPASLTNVDYCETHPAEGYAINVLGVKHVVWASNRVGAKLVYFSSDYVFDGKDGPYSEDATANPICEYGRQKLIAEHYVSLWAEDYLIIRTTVVYGWEPQQKNFVERLVKTLQKGQVLRVPDDQMGSPTYAFDLARAARDLVEAGASGVYHVVGPERASRYEFAREAARIFGLDVKLIRPVSTTELGQVAKRPLNAGMTAKRMQDVLGRELLDYTSGLLHMAQEHRL